MTTTSFDDFKDRLNKSYYQKYHVEDIEQKDIDILYKYIEESKKKQKEILRESPPKYLKKEFFLALEFKNNKIQYSGFSFEKCEWKEMTAEEFKKEISSTKLWIIKEQADTYIIFYRAELDEIKS